jgi:vitamin B12 transporter
MKILISIYYSLLLLCTFATISFGQIIIKGTITDTKHQPVESASIGVVGTYAGTSSEKDGTFEFDIDKKGTIKVLVRIIGYSDKSMDILISDTTKIIQINVILDESSVTLNDVVVNAKKTDFLSKKALIQMHTMEIRALGGGNADIANGFRTMPGVQATNSESGLFVRGGTGDETKVYIDGLSANNFFYSSTPEVSQRGRFNPELFSGNFFSSGGYSALYGQALSSTLILESNSIASRSTFSGNVSSIGGNIEHNRVIKPEVFSVGVSATYTNLAPYYSVVKQDRNFTAGPEFFDLIFNAKYKFKAGGTLKVLGTLGTNGIKFSDIRFNKMIHLGLRSNNGFGTLNYTGTIGEKLFINAGFGASISSNIIELDSTKTDGQTVYWDGKSQLNQQQYNSRLVFRVPFSGASDLYFGGEHSYNVVERSRFVREILRTNDSFTEHYGALFVESNITFSSKINGRIGLRAEGSSLLQETKLSPRASIFYNLSKNNKFTLSYGQFYQQPTYDYILRNSKKLSFQKATHYIVGYQKENATQIFRVELFHKDYNNLIRTLKDTTSTGYGYARGFEVFWKENGRLPNLNYWLSYSFLDTKREFLSYTSSVQPNFAAKHTFAAVTSYFIPKLSTNIGFTYTFSSGRPYYNPNRPANELMTDFTPAYHNTGVTIAYLGNFFKSNSILAFSVSNLLGNEQIFGYRYTDKNTREAITPLAQRFFYVGLFLNWGVDKRSKTINDLLN